MTIAIVDPVTILLQSSRPVKGLHKRFTNCGSEALEWIGTERYTGAEGSGYFARTEVRHSFWFHSGGRLAEAPALQNAEFCPQSMKLGLDGERKKVYHKIVTVL